jgi:hypothetical protein
MATAWDMYKDNDCPERDALRQSQVAGEKRKGLAEYLWDQGYRHGDHVLEYRYDGSFRATVLTMFPSMGSSPFLMARDKFAECERNLGNMVKPEHRTQRESQPDLSANEHSMMVPR